MQLNYAYELCNARHDRVTSGMGKGNNVEE
jgi:hypothetical protein